MREQGYDIAAIEQVENSVSLENVQWNQGEKIAIVFGHEVNGVSQKIVDLADNNYLKCMKIPNF